MKKLLPIFISVLIITVNVLSAQAADNVLRGVNVKKNNNAYTVELTSTAPARMTKTIVSSNRVIINLKDVSISSNLSTKFNGNTVVDNVMVEPCGRNNINIMVQGDNIAYSDIEFKEPTTVENMEENIKTSFTSLFGFFSASSIPNRVVQFAILFVFLVILIGEIRFIKSKYSELQTEREEMYKNITNTNDFKDYLPGYGRAGLKKPYTTPIYGTSTNPATIHDNYIKQIRTPEIVTLNTLLHNNNQETKIIDKIINNKPVFGELSNINLNENTPPKVEFSSLLKGRLPKSNVSNPIPTAKLKANLKYLEEMTALYKNEATPQETNTELKRRLNEIY